MKLAVLSDIHGNSSALEAVVSDIASQGVDQMVNLGDCFSGPLDGAGTARMLAEMPMPTVSGNHDRQLTDRPVDQMGPWERWVIGDLSDATLDWLGRLPTTEQVGDILLCHATPSSDSENWLDRRGPEQRLISRDLHEIEARLEGATAPMILCGHNHSPRSVRLPSGQMIVNPGSVGCPAYLDTRMEPNFIHQTGSPDARYAIIERTGDDWTASLRTVPYDASPMIRLAEEKGAASWAKALATGWIA